MIKNSVGSNLFRNLYILKNGKSEDILDDGDLSCAFFVSFILHQMRLIKSPHATVSGLVKDMIDSGWIKTDSPKEGDILLWEPQAQIGDELHAHIGFYINKNKAISNSYKKKVPIKHPIFFDKNSSGISSRKIEAIYTNAKIQ